MRLYEKINPINESYLKKEDITQKWSIVPTTSVSNEEKRKVLIKFLEKKLTAKKFQELKIIPQPDNPEYKDSVITFAIQTILSSPSPNEAPDAPKNSL